MYSRSWTTSENLCNRNTNLFFHTSCAHIVSAKAPHQQFTKRQLTHKETHNKNRWFCNSITKSPVQRNHQHNEITSTTKSPAQQHHQHNEITSEQHQRNKITSTNEITSTTKSPAKRNHQHNNISSTTRSPPAAQQHHQRNEITTKSPAQHNEITRTTKAPAQPSNAKQNRIAHNRRRRAAPKTGFRHPSSKNAILQRFVIRNLKGKWKPSKWEKLTRELHSRCNYSGIDGDHLQNTI